MMVKNSASASEALRNYWKNMNAATGGAVRREVMPDVVKFSRRLSKGTEVLDIGCGMGRHTVYLAKNGFKVTAFDGSEEAVSTTKKWLNEEGLHASVTLKDFNDFRYPKESFEGVLSINVIHHTYEKNVRRIIDSIWRSLKPNGFFLCIAPKFIKKKKGDKQVESHTFIPTEGAEIGIPHFHFDDRKVTELFAKFDVRKVGGKVPTDKWNHYVILATKIV